MAVSRGFDKCFVKVTGSNNVEADQLVWHIVHVYVLFEKYGIFEALFECLIHLPSGSNFFCLAYFQS